MKGERRGRGRLAGALAICLIYAMPVLARAAGASTPPAWQKLEGRVLDVLARQNPVDASQAGLHDYDSRVPDYSAGSVRARVRELKSLLREAKAFPVARLSAETRLDRQLMLRELQMRLRVLEVERPWQKSPYFYANYLSSGVTILVINHYGAPDTLAAVLTARLKAFPRGLAQARANVLRPPHLLAYACAQTMHSLPEVWQQSLPALVEGASADSKKRLNSAISEASDAISAYLEAMGEAEEEHGNDDYPLGRANYDWRLKNVEGLDMTGAELAAQGDRWLAEMEAAIANVDSLRKSRGLPALPLPPLKAPPDFTREQLMHAFVAAIDSVRRFTQASGLVTVPDFVGPMVPISTPQPMRAVVPGLAMFPPATFDTSTVGTYLLGNSYPDSLTPQNRDRFYSDMVRMRLVGGSVHEGFPGHHLQLSIAKHENSRMRRWTNSTTMVEGWAFYCEELAARAGIYGPDSLEYLARVLQGMKFRACRVIVDARIHTGVMTYEQAVKFMRDHNTTFDSLRASGEVLRYVTEPTQAMSYLVGKSLILGLRREVEQREGADFSPRKFHDKFLTYGSIPVPWIARAWIGHVPKLGRWNLGRY